MQINNQRLPVHGKIKMRLHTLHNIKHALIISLYLKFTYNANRDHNNNIITSCYLSYNVALIQTVCN